VKDADGHPVFDYLGDYPINDLIQVLNNEKTPSEPILTEYQVKGPDIIVGGRLWLRIRGWGYLTGHSEFALGLLPSEAASKQNELRTWILEKIS
jgi:hypothetical protein